MGFIEPWYERHAPRGHATSVFPTISNTNMAAIGHWGRSDNGATTIVLFYCDVTGKGKGKSKVIPVF
jgi:hypothetical protein